MGRLRALAAALLVVAACKSESKPATENRPATPKPDAAAAAEPPRKEQPLEKPSEAFRKALRQGRELVRAKKYKEAIAELDRALAIAPDNPRVMSELSVAALRAGDLERAKKTAQMSVTLAFDPRLKAASLYNLGAAYEKEGNKKAAIEAYVKSLELRPHAGVEKKLVALGGMAPSKTPIDLIGFAGPHAGLEALCKAGPEPMKGKCFVHDMARASKVGPFVAAAAVRLEDREEKPKGWTWGSNCHLALETERGWFIAYNGLACEDHDITSVAIEPEGELVAVRSGSYRSSRSEGMYQDWLQLCGVGPSGVPSCTEPVETGYELIMNDDETGEESREDDDYTVTIEDGALTVSDGEHRGRHKLAFP